jgi:hypothetical protein
MISGGVGRCLPVCTLGFFLKIGSASAREIYLGMNRSANTSAGMSPEEESKSSL